ncbi:hypothetical protein [Sansalvadorimonas verongulae]|uniref:hypothetical protein n=1 Tax=Sansalvadorimonas verongulae TaxID=2172824 RepID=UPI0012BCAE88|nr:hypothetical protein [Sansalvadorimonas verongulae]MTI15223.1 hypothetical protein [Sansalvadorimonas verongulae]
MPPQKPIQGRKTLFIPRDEELRAALLNWTPFTFPTYIPSSVSDTTRDRAQSFHRGAEKTLQTTVPGTGVLTTEAPHSAIRLSEPTEETEFDSTSTSTPIAPQLDTPSLSQCSDRHEQEVVSGFSTRQDTIPEGSWLAHQLSPEPPPREPYQEHKDSLLHRTTGLGDDYGLPADQLHQVHDDVLRHNQQLENIRKVGDQLQDSTQELHEKASQLHSLLHNHTTSSKLKVSETARLEHETHTFPEPGTKEFQELQSRVSDLEHSLQESLSTNEELIQAQESLKQELALKHEEVRALQTDLRQLKSRKVELEHACSQLTRESGASRAKVDQLKQEADQLTHRIHNYETTVQTQQRELEDIQEVLSCAQAAHKGCQETILDLKRKVHHLSQENDSTAQMLFTVQQQLASAESKNQQAETALQQTSEKLTTALHQIQKLKEAANIHKHDKTVWEQEREKAKRELYAHQQRIRELEAQQKRLTQHYADLQKTNYGTAQNLTRTQHDLEAAQAQLEDVGKELQHLRTSYAGLKAQLEERDAKIQHLEEEGATVCDGLTSAKEQLAGWKKRDSSLLESIRQSQMVLDSHEEQQLASMTDAVPMLVQRVLKAEVQLDNMATQYSQSILVKRQQQDEIERQKRALREQQQALTKCTEALQRTEQDLTQRTEEVNTATNRVSETLTLAETLKLSSTEITGENQRLTNRVSDLEDSGSRKDEEIRQLAEALKNAKAENRALEDSRQELVRQLAHEKDTVSGSAALIDSLRVQLDDNAQQNLQLQTEINTAHKQLAACHEHGEQTAIKLATQYDTLARADREVKELITTLSLYKDMVKGKNAEIERLQALAEGSQELASENRDLMIKLTDAEVAQKALQSEVEREQKARERLLGDAYTLTERVSDLTRDLDTAQQRTQKVKEERDKAREILENQLRPLQQEMEQVQSILRGQDVHMKGLQTELAVALGAAEEQHKAVLEKQKALDEALNREDELRESNSTLNKQLNEVLNTVKQQAEETRKISADLMEYQETFAREGMQYEHLRSVWLAEEQKLNMAIEACARENDLERKAWSKKQEELEASVSDLQSKLEVEHRAERSHLELVNKDLETTAQKWEQLASEHKDELETLKTVYEQTIEAMTQIEYEIIQQIKQVSDPTNSALLEEPLPHDLPNLQGNPLPDHVRTNLPFIRLELHKLARRWRDEHNRQIQLEQELREETQKYDESCALLEEASDTFDKLHQTEAELSQVKDENARLKPLTEEQQARLSKYEKALSDLVQINREQTDRAIKYQEMLGRLDTTLAKGLGSSRDTISYEDYQDTVKKMEQFCRNLQATHSTELTALQEELAAANEHAQELETGTDRLRDEINGQAAQIRHEKELLQATLDNTQASLASLRATKEQIKTHLQDWPNHEVLITLLESIEDDFMQGKSGWQEQLERLDKEGIKLRNPDEKQAEDNAYRIIKLLLTKQEHAPVPPLRRLSGNNESNSSSSDEAGDSGVDIVESQPAQASLKKSHMRPPPPSRPPAIEPSRPTITVNGVRADT